MNAENLKMVSGICFAISALSFPVALMIWFRLGIPGVYRELKEGRKHAAHTGSLRKAAAADDDCGTEVLPGCPDIVMIEDIVMIHSEEIRVIKQLIGRNSGRTPVEIPPPHYSDVY